MMCNVLRDSSARSWILLNPTSIGDTWTTCALARSFKDTHEGNLTMVVKPSHAPIAQLYQSDIDKIIQIDDNTLIHYSKLIQQFCRFDIDQPFVAHPFFIGDGRLFRFWEIYGGRRMGGVSFSDIYRHILHLDWDAPFAPPVIPQGWRHEAQLYCEKLGLIPGKSVILIPDNNSCEALPDVFWQALANELNLRGLMVFTNSVGGMGKRRDPFNGTTSIELSLQSAIPVVEMAGRYISGSNGLSHMLAGCQVNSNGTLLLNQRAPGKEYSVNGIPVEDAVRQTSIRTAWVTNKPIREYVVFPDKDMRSIICDIADDNPKSALAPAVYQDFSQ